MPVVEIEKLTKFYGRVPGVVELDLSVKEGEIFGFVGPNGSGKSTTIRTLMGFLQPTAGHVKIFGMDAFRESARIKKDVGYVPNHVDYYSWMTADEIIDFTASFRKNVSRKRREELCEAFEVDGKKRFSRMSVGNRKKVALVQALMHDPRLLILDEATSGLDPMIKRRLMEQLRALNRGGSTIFFCSNNLSEVQDLCGRTAIIRGGSIIETKETSVLTGGSARKVKVRTGDDITSVLDVFKIKDARKVDDYTVFLYDGRMDNLVKALANFTVTDLQVALPSLEDAILRYYEKQLEREEEIFV